MNSLFTSGAYWLGVATLPVLLALGAITLRVLARVVAALRRRGLTFETQLRRTQEWFYAPTVRRDIWWERALGPVIVGGWYHEDPQYVGDHVEHRRLFNRWVGFGLRRGPNITMVRKSDLGLVTAEKVEPTK